MALSNKQQAFINAYLKSWNATRAAIEAGYSEHTARAIGSENLTKPDIAAEIKRRVAENTMSADEVLVRLTEQARAAYAPYITAGGAVDIAKLVADGKAHLIKSIKQTEYGKNVEFYDAYDAKVMIGKHHKLFVERTEHTGANGEPLAIILDR